MVNVLLNGRLGNNLFQIAAGASLAKANHTEAVFYIGNHVTFDKTALFDYLEPFRSNILRKVDLRPGTLVGAESIKEQQFEYSPIPYSDGALVEGFFQSERYFDPALVRELFAIDEQTKQYIDQKYGDILKGEITSIHVRRGDYYHELDNHPMMSMYYFKRAIDQIGKNSRFLICSNDIEWCKSRFKGDNFTFAENESAIVDLYLQSMCTNNIISNSSFSWWAAWLNAHPNKKVVAPFPWFGVAKSHVDTRDLYPENWIRIENKMEWKHVIRGYYIWYRRRIHYFISTKLGIYK